MFWFLGILLAYIILGILVTVQSIRVEKNNSTWRDIAGISVLLMVIVWPFYACCSLLPYYLDGFATYIVRIARRQSRPFILLNRMQQVEAEIVELRCETVSLLLAREAKEIVKETFELAGAEVVGVGITRVDNRYGVKVNLKSPTTVTMTNFMGVPIKTEVVGKISAQRVENNSENETTS